MTIKDILRKLIYRQKADTVSYVKYLRSLGCKIGERSIIYVPIKTHIDETRPWLISIGDDVHITEGVTILTHGFDWSVLKGIYGEILGSSGCVSIGNNVFVGMNTTILKGVSIGNNVIIGAGSLVNKDIPDNVVAAGNPCRVIMNLDEYYHKRKNAQYHEAEELVRLYRERYDNEPPENVLHEFFWLFCNNPEKLTALYKSMMQLGGNEILSNQRMLENKSRFKDMNEFLNSIR